MKLNDAEMSILQHILVEMMPGYTVYAFGSRVHGRGLKPFSDIDLAIVSDSPIATDALCHLKEEFSESDLPYRVDVVDYAAASANFRAIIAQDYEVIYEPSEDSSNDKEVSYAS